MRFEIVQVALGVGRSQVPLAGHALGDRVYRTVVEPTITGEPGQVVLLSFRDVEFATGSFLKATWLRLVEDGVAAVLAHLSEEVRSEFAFFLAGNRLPGLEALDWTKGGISLAYLHGPIEPAALRALQALVKHPGSTAPELHQASKDGVSATAWTNRLNELCRQGLAIRGDKAGRAWRYFPVTRKVQHG